MSTKTTSSKVSNSLFLVRQPIKAASSKEVVVEAVNHVAIIDCSGSMYAELPRIREQLKKRIPKLLKEQDTLSVIWFSGRGQCGVLLEAEPIATLTDLQAVNGAIDRWLKTVGLTGFKEPIELVSKLVATVAKKNSNPFAMFFMSDGCDNQWSRQEILKAVELVSGKLASASFVEYGYYADRPLLTAMAEKAGGTLLFAEDFDKYAPTFEGALQRKVSGAPRVEIAVKGDPIGGFVFALQGSDLLSFEVVGGKATVPEDLTEIAYISPSSVGTAVKDLGVLSESAAKDPGGKDTDGVFVTLSAAYAAVSLFSIRMKPEVLYPLLRALGDVTYIEQFSACFGKQKYSSFMEATKESAFDAKKRFTKGWDPKKVPREDAFTVLQLLEILSADENNRVLTEHPAFNYNRIGRGRNDSSEIITPAEQQEITGLTAKMASEKDPKKVKEMADRIAEITGNKGPALKFEPDPAPNGYSIDALVTNEVSPNISFRVRKTGTIDLSSRIPDNLKGSIHNYEKFKTFIYRNYAVVKHGIINIPELPVRITAETADKLRAEGVITTTTPAENGMQDVVLDLLPLPIVNRQMVKSASAKALIEKTFELTRVRAMQKVFNSVKKEKFAKKSENFEVLYGGDAALWLKEQGFSDNGFSPKSVQAEVTDFYMGKEMNVKLKGYSTIPSLNEFKKQAAKGRLNGPAQLMEPAVKEIDAYLESAEYKKAADPDKAFEKWLDKRAKETTAKVRDLLFEVARITFSIIVGQVWFTEFKTIDETQLTVTTSSGTTLECDIQLREIQIEI